eukprot:SM000178S03474  [mRNA]  locus=s178:240009:249945:- [translate_table: standard]
MPNPKSKSSAAAALEALAAELRAGRLSIPQLVGGLGDYLTTEDNAVRARGTLLLSELTRSLAGVPLAPSALHNLAAFFTARLSDWPALTGALTGALALLERQPPANALAVIDVSALARAALAEVQVQVLAQPARMLALSLLELLLDRYPAATVGLGTEVVEGVLSAVDGEKDPRCLLRAFRILKLLADSMAEHGGETDHGGLAGVAEDMFETMACYFPISFTPPPGDPRGVTREDLAASLQGAMVASPEFAPYLIPLLIDKLGSSLVAAKLDSLGCMRACAEAFPAPALEPHLDCIWQALWQELLPSAAAAALAAGDSGSGSVSEAHAEKVRALALACLTTLAREPPTGPGMAGVVLRDPRVNDLLSAVPTEHDSQSSADASMGTGGIAIGEVLAAVARTSAAVGESVAAAVLVPLLARSSGQDAAGDCCSLKLAVAADVVDALREACAGSSPSLRSVSQDLVKLFCGPLPDTVDNLTANPGAVRGLRVLSTFSVASGGSPLDRHQAASISRLFASLLLAHEGLPSLQDAATSALVAVAVAEEPTEQGTVLHEAVEPLLNELTRQGRQAQDLERRLPTIFQALVALAAARADILGHVIVQLEDFVLGNFVKAMEGSGAQHVAMTLQVLARQLLVRPDVGIGQRDLVFASRLWSLAVDAAGECKDATQEVLALSAANAMRRIVQGHSLEKQENLLDELRRRRFAGPAIARLEVPALPLTATEGIAWAPCHVALLAGVVVALRQQTTVAQDKGLLILLLNYAVAEDHHKPGISDLAAMAVAAMLNKWPEESAQELVSPPHVLLDEMLLLVLDETLLPAARPRELRPVEQEEGASTSGRREERGTTPKPRRAAARRQTLAVAALGHVARGLAMRGHKRSADIVDVLLTLLQIEMSKQIVSGNQMSGCEGVPAQELEELVIVAAASRALAMICEDTEDALGKDDHIQLKLLYKQRVFQNLLGLLIEGTRTFPQANYLQAFATCLRGLPNSVLKLEIGRVVPLLLESLSVLKNEGTGRQGSNLRHLTSALFVLANILMDPLQGGEVVSNYLPSIVSRLLPLLSYLPSRTVRETALQCLLILVDFSHAQLYPLRTQVVPYDFYGNVLKALNKALDDPKRSGIFDLSTVVPAYGTGEGVQILKGRHKEADAYEDSAQILLRTKGPRCLVSPSSSACYFCSKCSGCREHIMLTCF